MSLCSGRSSDKHNDKTTKLTKKASLCLTKTMSKTVLHHEMPSTTELRYK